MNTDKFCAVARNAVVAKNSSDPFVDKNPGIGDRVYLYVVGKNRKGTIIDHTPSRPWMIRVKWDNGDVDDLNPLEVRLLNSTVKNAKFKVGDIVKFNPAGSWSGNQFAKGKTYIVKGFYGDGKVDISPDPDSSVEWYEKDFVLANAVAKNSADDRSRWLAEINKMKQALKFWDEDFPMYASNGEWSEVRNSERLARMVDDAFSALYTALNKASQV